MSTESSRGEAPFFGAVNSGATPLRLFSIFALIFCVGLLMVLIDTADGHRSLADVDDQLRELQIRSLIASGRWYDLTLPFVSMPQAYVSPWSRLVDFPYVAIARFLTRFIPNETALRAAFHIWPPMMLLMFSGLAAACVRHVVRGVEISNLLLAASLVAMTGLMSIAILEFSPGRIDHHNVQLVSMLMIFLGLVRWDAIGGILIGLGSAISIVVGLECLPFVVFAFGGLLLCHVLRVAGISRVLISASLAMIVATVTAAAVVIGPMAAISTQCDAFSAPYIVLMAGYSVIFVLCSLIGSPTTMLGRILALGLPSIGFTAVVPIFFGPCMAGPYAIIDPTSRTYWFDRIWQEHSFFYFYGNGQYDKMALITFTAAILTLAFPLFVRSIRSASAGLLIAYGLAALSVILTLMLTRYIRFPLAFVPLFVPWIVGFYTGSERYKRVDKAATGAAVACVVGFGAMYFVIPPFPPNFDAVDYMSFDDCGGQDFSVLSSVSPGRVEVPQGLAMPFLLAMPPGFTLGSIPFHRASPGMKRMFDAFLTSDPDVRRAALEPFDYVAVCRFPLKADQKQAPLYAALAAGEPWPGLERVAHAPPSNFQLFRIDHARLQ